MSLQSELLSSHYLVGVHHVGGQGSVHPVWAGGGAPAGPGVHLIPSFTPGSQGWGGEGGPGGGARVTRDVESEAGGDCGVAWDPGAHPHPHLLHRPDAVGH